MVVRNGVESKRMTSGDFDLTSVSSSRVLLPCRPWGEMRLEMMNAAYGMMTQQELHKVKDFPYEEAGISPSYNWRKGKNILPVYKYGERVIWGVTARIVRGFVKKM